VRSALVGALYLLLPLLGGAIVHGVCMRFDWLTFLKRPIDGGLTLRGRRIFGHSKTWCGPVLVSVGAALVWTLQRLLHALPSLVASGPIDYATLPGPWFAALAGFVAELGELPNSCVKRQLGIAPGATARGPLSVLFYVWDQIDVVLGYWLVLAFVVPEPLLPLAISLAIGTVIHPLLTLIGYGLRMRPTAR
jgi:hypothetical protein